MVGDKSTLALAQDLRSNYDIPKLLTRQLNQDPLENTFATVRQQHGCCRNPNVQQFENGLRHNYITSISRMSSNSNCEMDFTYMLTKLSKLKESSRNVNPVEISVNTSLTNINEITEEVTLAEDNAIIYVSGFVVRKYLNIINNKLNKIN